MAMYFKVSSIYDGNGLLESRISNIVEAKEKPPNSVSSFEGRDTFFDWFESEKEALSYIKRSYERKKSKA